MVIHSLLGHEPPRDDLAVAQSVGDERQDLELAGSEVGGVRAGGRTLSARHAESAALAELAGEIIAAGCAMQILKH